MTFFTEILLSDSKSFSEPTGDCDWSIEVFFDNDCPLCRREVRLIRWMDRKNRIRFIDISSPQFRPERYQKTLSEMMDEIHGRLPNSEWIVGVEVFRQIYSSVGLGPFVWVSRLPGIRHVLDFAYRYFAKNRLKFSGRCNSYSCETPAGKKVVS